MTRLWQRVRTLSPEVHGGLFPTDHTHVMFRVLAPLVIVLAVVAYFSVSASLADPVTEVEPIDIEIELDDGAITAEPTRIAPRPRATDDGDDTGDEDDASDGAGDDGTTGDDGPADDGPTDGDDGTAGVGGGGTGGTTTAINGVDDAPADDAGDDGAVDDDAADDAGDDGAAGDDPGDDAGDDD